MEHVLGQSRAVHLLESMLACGRLHHAYIFHGPSGVGKCTTAHAFAACLLCHQPQPDLAGNPRPCGTCPGCIALREQRHPDLHLIYKELALHSEDASIRNRKLLSIPVQVLREYLLAPVQRSAGLQHHKVFIVDEAELLQPAAQNVLLKTLEEPPAGTFIILVTSQEDRLLPTIRSRCQRVAFTNLPPDAATAWLHQHVEKQLQLGEQRRAAPPRQQKHLPPGLDEPPSEHHVSWLLHFAEGSPGRMALALHYDLHAWAQQVLPDLDAMATGRFAHDLGQFMGEAIASESGFAARWVKDHTNASKEAANQLGCGLMFRLISQHLRHRLAEAAQACPAGDPLIGEAALEPYLNAIEAVRQAESELSANVNIRLACHLLAARLFEALRPLAQAGDDRHAVPASTTRG